MNSEKGLRKKLNFIIDTMWGFISSTYDHYTHNSQPNGKACKGTDVIRDNITKKGK